MTTRLAVHAAVPVRVIRSLAGPDAPMMGAEPRQRQDARAYLAAGGYRGDGGDAVAAARRVALLGRGGAGFPVADKIDAVAAGPGPRVVVGNGEEGEPASAKDRYLLRYRPHLVIDGARAAAAAVQADRIVVYVSDPEAADVLLGAIADPLLPPGLLPEVFRVAPAFVAGEETAVVRAIDGGPAKPLAKPPRPYESGLGGHPTLVANVESLARLAVAVRPDGSAAASTVLATVQDGDRAGLYEVPADLSLGELLAEHGMADEPVAVLAGGFSGGIHGTGILDTPLRHGAFRDRRALLGAAAFIALGADDCPVGAAVDVATYLASSSSGQCGVCVVGTEAVRAAIRAIALGEADADAAERLLRRGAALAGRGNCGLPTAASTLITTLFENFGPEVAKHASGRCERCRSALEPPGTGDTRFRVGIG